MGVAAVDPGLYEVLGVSPEAPTERIAQAIATEAADARVLQYSSDPALAAEARWRLAVIEDARRTLLVPANRLAYDRYRSGLPPAVRFRPTVPYHAPRPVRAAPYGPPKSKVAAAVLAFTLGEFGVHNFYLGRNGLGVAQLLITVLTCGIGMIVTWPWAVIDGVLILTGNVRDRNGQPLT
jgi:TM2 domain-containing membrane protein YozV